MVVRFVYTSEQTISCLEPEKMIIAIQMTDEIVLMK